MQADLCLSARDILEIISSALLAEMNYQQRMNNICGNTLSPDFIPDSSTFPHIDKIISRIGTQLGLSNPEDLHGLSVGNMSEFTFQLNQGRPETLTFFTSGSTGIPVPSPTRFIDLEQEIRALADIFPERQRIISLVPRHHIYGFLFCILLPKALNIPVEFKSPLPTPKLVECMKPGDLVIAFPLLWGKLAKQNILFPEKIFAVTSTGPCPAETINGLQQKGLARMTEVYGSSETGGVGFRHDPAGFYTLLPYWKKKDDNTIYRCNAGGSPACEYELQDSFEWQDHHHFKPLRRVDKAVQVGGINVYPAKVENFFRKQPQVKECSVRLMRHDEGERLKIFIVPAANHDPLHIEKQLRAAAATLSTHERPGSYTFGPVIPVSSMGKRQDW